MTEVLFNPSGFFGRLAQREARIWPAYAVYLLAVLLTVTGGLIGVVLAAAVLYGVVLAVPFFEAFILSPLTVALALGVSA
ncbi:MAG TPA: hypothetical protein ENK37_02435, partial [Oceanithermus profundus]|nr:hypothetical protein [Oceanithermus profundus]